MKYIFIYFNLIYLLNILIKNSAVLQVFLVTFHIPYQNDNLS